LQQPPTHTPFPYTTLFRSRTSQRSSSQHNGGSRMNAALLKKLWKQRFGSAPNKTFLEFFCGLWPFYEPDYRDFLYAWEVSTIVRSEEHTSELQSRGHLVCR